MPTTATTIPEAPSHELQSRAAWKRGVLGSLNFAAQILAVRVILLVAVVGAVALAWLAAAEHDLYRIAALGVYTLTVVLPVTVLALKR